MSASLTLTFSDAQIARLRVAYEAFLRAAEARKEGQTRVAGESRAQHEARLRALLTTVFRAERTRVHVQNAIWREVLADQHQVFLLLLSVGPHTSHGDSR